MKQVALDSDKFSARLEELNAQIAQLKTLVSQRDNEIKVLSQLISAGQSQPAKFDETLDTTKPLSFAKTDELLLS